MKRTRIQRGVGASLLAATAIVGAAVWARAGMTLYINGQTASKNVFMHDGVPCVPVQDVAGALNLTLVKKPDGYALAPAGGANQVNGLAGKVGDKLTNGSIVFTVVKVFRGDKYQKQFDTGEVTPANANEDVVAITCRLKNATPKTVSISPMGGPNTALTDMDEHSIQPFSGLAADIHSRGVDMLPGSAVDFALTFSVPKTAKLKDLVYQAAAYSADPKLRPTFRVSVATP